MTSVKVFLSSTFSDFTDERREVLDVFRRMRTVEHLNVDVITMEDFGFSDSRPLEKCVELLGTANAYLGLLGQRYGSIAPGGRLSYSEHEYRKAHELKLPIFILERTGHVLSSEIETDPRSLGRLQRLKADARSKHLVLEFESPQELGRVLVQYLPDQLRRSFPCHITQSRQKELLVPFFKLGDRTSPLHKECENAKTLDVLAMSAIGFVRERATIEHYIGNGCHIRILIVKRDGIAQQLIEVNKGSSHLSSDLRQAVIRTHDLSVKTKRMNGSIEMREIDWVPSVTLFLFDSRLETAIGWIGMYTPDISSDAASKWVVQLSKNLAGNPLEFYAAQFQQLWDRGVPSW